MKSARKRQVTVFSLKLGAVYAFIVKCKSHSSSLLSLLTCLVVIRSYAAQQSYSFFSWPLILTLLVFLACGVTAQVQGRQCSGKVARRLCSPLAPWASFS
ncbi:hypothetical protein BJX66DRAFT_92829 [Aspergillus keveii]|uniref:Uncharacterized protein n=1 Tax=Aspergillus keveii TaxID=714993 RepID=A0ABR4GG01_9EURO